MRLYHHLSTSRLVRRLALASFACLLVLAAPAHATSVVQLTPGDDLTQAINNVEDGGIIELAAGIYPADGDPFLAFDPGKRLTIRAAEGAVVELTGGTSHDGIFQYTVQTWGEEGHITFEDLIFRDGVGDTFKTRAGGVTMIGGSATFVRCQFLDNHSEHGAGGLWIFNSNDVAVAEAKCIDCYFQGNTTTENGGGIAVSKGELWVHDSEFVSNRSNVAGHSKGSSGGAIHVSNSTARISNSRFEANQAALAGGALYAIGGSWPQGGGDPPSDVVVSNSTFVDNFVVGDPAGEEPISPAAGGAIHIEDDTDLSLYNSRLITNTATLGGGLSLYRASALVEDSAFLGNLSDDLLDELDNTFGGAIKASSDDRGVDTTDWPTASLTVRDSYIQGRYGGVGAVAPIGGGIYVKGDKNSRYGLGGVSARGTLSSNRVPLVLERVIFHDLDVYSTTRQANGGALFASLADVTMDDCLFLGNDASDDFNDTSTGGAMRLFLESRAAITNTTFADNSAELLGGAIYSQGSELDLSSSRLVENEVSPGISETFGSSYGAALWTGPCPSGACPTDLEHTGSVSGNVFSQNVGMAIYERDEDSGPINATTYEANDFFETTFGDDVYRNQLDAGTPYTPAELNALTITRSGASNTDKSPASNNSSLGSEPSTAHVVASPPSVIAPTASGDASSFTKSYAAYAWSGGSATFDGNGAVSPFDVVEVGSGTHTLNVDSGSATDSDSVGSGPTPAGTFSADPREISSGGSSTLEWTRTGGTFVDSCLAHDVGTAGTASGSVIVSPTHTSTYYFLLLTKQGGADLSATVYVDEPAPNDAIFSDGFESGDLSAWDASVGN